MHFNCNSICLNDVTLILMKFMWGVTESGCGGIVFKRWGVEWYHPCRRGMTRSGLGPPTRLLPFIFN